MSHASHSKTFVNNSEATTEISFHCRVASSLSFVSVSELKLRTMVIVLPQLILGW
ncbi:MAG: hypothetical protein AAGA60_21105 [Cyanobacteria bacterium P01_E01_bin.42]